MKIFKFLTITSIGLISLGFTSCSNDDDAPAENKPEELTVKKRLKSMTYTKEVDVRPAQTRTETYKFTDFVYDGGGRILSYNEFNESYEEGGLPGGSHVSSGTKKYNYNYSDDKITTTEQDNRYTASSDYVTFNGLIRSHVLSYGKTVSYTYDGNKLNRAQYSEYGYGVPTYTFDWDYGLKSEHYKDNYQEEDIRYTYINNICPSAMVYYGVGRFPFNDDCDIDPVLADAGYFGEKMFPRLLSEYTLQDGDGVYEGYVFSYEFDNDGYVTSMSAIGTGENVGYDYKYTYVWE